VKRLEVLEIKCTSEQDTVIQRLMMPVQSSIVASLICGKQMACSYLMASDLNKTKKNTIAQIPPAARKTSPNP